MSHTLRIEMTLTFALLLFSLVSTAWAEPRLTLEIVADKEVTEVRDGEKNVRYTDADEATRGDVIRYTLVYRNAGDSPAVGASFVDPIPEGTVYIEGSAGGDSSRVLFSADGGRNYAPAPLLRTVRGPDGKSRQETIPPEEYTHVRWQLEQPVTAGAEGQVNFKVRVR